MLNIGSGYSIANAITTTRTSANGMANFKINITAIEDVFTWQKDGGVSSAPIEIIGFLNPHTITD